MEYRYGLGNVVLSDCDLDSALSTNSNPLPNEIRSLTFNNCKLKQGFYEDVNSTSSTLLTFNGCLLGDAILMRNSGVCVKDCVFTEKKTGVQSYAHNTNIFVIGNLKQQTLPLVFLTSGSQSNNCVLTNNTVYSSTVYQDSGTSNTVKENGNFSYA